MMYVIVYRNDPRFKGTDHYAMPDRSLTSEIKESKFYYHRPDAVKDLKNLDQKIRGFIKRVYTYQW